MLSRIFRRFRRPRVTLVPFVGVCKLSERIKERERVTGPRRLPKGNKAPRRRQPPPPAHLVSLDYTILERRKPPARVLAWGGIHWSALRGTQADLRRTDSSST